ncbi:MAG TPA: DeoR/GlpR family DNA-binding transcription regulator [Herpetosiphonaceae bacterium]|nr:DeoR/GlpR family DNA-binding transcription regulator [Herpetosiphonaceae bacterium]
MTAKTVSNGQPSLAAERRERIAELVMHKGAVHISELTQRYGVSEVTIRHDLDVLASQGVVVRERGGALANVQTTLAKAFEQRSDVNPEAKRRIGQRAAQLVKPGDTIIMDAGTTVMEMARHVRDVAPLTVITNALNVASQVGGLAGCHVILTGGSLSIETISTVGPLAERDFGELIVGKLFLGAHTVDLEAGIVDTSIEVARVKRAMIQAARETILLVDSSKWETHRREAFARVAPLTAVHQIITDSGLPDDVRPAIERLRIELTVV